MPYTIVVKTPKNSGLTDYFRLKIRGFKRIANRQYIKELNINEKKFQKFKDFCRQYKYKCRIDNEFTERSTDYRLQFFKSNPPHFLNMYFCSYCGKLVNKRKITVDHLYPVYAAQTSIKIQKKLRKKGYSSVNDVRNLIPACEKCNKRKGSKLGEWIIKGEIGRIYQLWIIRHSVRIYVLYYIFSYVYTHNLFHIQELIRQICKL